MAQTVLESRHINKYFTDPVRVQVLTDVTFSINQGEFVSTIGKSGTRAAREAAAKTEHQLPDVIGQFGIGFLSGFVVGSKVEVYTRHWAAGERAVH